MHASLSARRWTAALMLAAITVTSVAPAAEASHSRWRRYKGPGGYPPRAIATQRVVIERHSDAGPAIAGFLGGLIVGAVLSNAQQQYAPPPPEYRYDDPYCHESFMSLDLYREHLYRHHHPRVVRVIQVSSGSCVDTWQWRDGGWCDQGDDDWGDRDWDN